MKHLFTFLTFVIICIGVNGQEDLHEIAVGDLLTFEKTSNLPFEHIHFPRTNFIIKRGGIATYKNLNGVKVKVVEIYDDNVVKLTSLSGKKFFNKFAYVKADLIKALQKKELHYVDLRKQSAIAVSK